ncbi:hypothetical protein EOL96_09465 [Candidatus Saccharibacteria bacterium]|nr:hypothetical protein [Candidatus Saccharibacteria bacterium]
MKKIIALLMLILVVSCEKEGEPKVNELYGTWTVTHFKGDSGFYSIETEHNKPVYGETVLSFSDGTYTMKGWFGNESGTLTEDGNILTLSIGNTAKHRITLSVLSSGQMEATHTHLDYVVQSETTFRATKR